MIRKLTQRDREMVMEYLERNHIETTFLIGNVIEFGMDNDLDKRRCGDYFGYFENGELKGILPFYNLGSCIPHFEAEGAVGEFIEVMKGRSFSFLLGMERFITPLYEGIKDFKETLDYSEDSYYINNSFKPFKLEGVEIKDLEEIGIDAVVDFNIHANRDGFGNIHTRESTIKSLSQKPKGEDFLFLTADGKITAQGCIQTSTEKIDQIGGVYTIGEERGKGYCKALVSELCDRIVKRGKIPTLMVTKSNTPAVRAYTSLGFGNYDDYLIIKLKE